MTPTHMKLLTAALLGGLAVSGVMVARAAEDEKPQTPSNTLGGQAKQPLGADAPEPAAEPAKDAPSDPTQPSLLLQEVLRGSGPSGREKTQPQKIPNVSLKARMIVADQPAVAMLDIEGTFYTVQQDVELVFASPTHGTISMTITKLDRKEIQIQLAPLNQTLILR